MYHHCKPSLYWESANASSLQLFFVESHSASWGCSKYITSPGSLTHRKNTKNCLLQPILPSFTLPKGSKETFWLWHYWKFILSNSLAGDHHWRVGCLQLCGRCRVWWSRGTCCRVCICWSLPFNLIIDSFEFWWYN